MRGEVRFVCHPSIDLFVLSLFIRGILSGKLPLKWLTFVYVGDTFAENLVKIG